VIAEDVDAASVEGKNALWAGGYAQFAALAMPLDDVERPERQWLP
jgi:hypothetical protein